MFEWQIAYRDEDGNPVELGEMLRIAVREQLLDPHTLLGLELKTNFLTSNSW
jgi:hypothetical protein